MALQQVVIKFLDDENVGVIYKFAEDVPGADLKAFNKVIEDINRRYGTHLAPVESFEDMMDRFE